MFFDTSLCIGIMAVMPVIVILVLLAGYALHQYVTLPKEKRFTREPVVISTASTATLVLWIITPFVVAQTGILNHSHLWKWYVGCAFCGLIGFFLIVCTVFPQGRAALGKKPIVLLPWVLFLGAGVAFIASS